MSNVGRLGRWERSNEAESSEGKAVCGCVSSKPATIAGQKEGMGVEGTDMERFDNGSVVNRLVAKASNCGK
ncbi:MAG: hypothetical protein CL912_06740 [Deltaproteobacteria bacterium]|nr:hypothetical protein [Deltaproteobacteria bacterium]|tara:strand:- start:29 stop:241 length:213 start_codon:yes stop_codon:yes gene_type:complete